jgi:hypothetical protein
MKSCRNCARSSHGWGPRPDLVCKWYAGAVLAPVSMSTEENEKADQRLRTTAERCHAYKPEGEQA